MSSGPRRDKNQTKFSSGTPHFFKIILEETLQGNKLRIPQKFVMKYGKTLSNSVFVKLPCGSKWKMELTKKEDNIWLEKGWSDFAKHYAIKRGSMLIFRYEGNSEFHAVIFHTSTVEIDYPSSPVDFDKFDVDLELRAPKVVVVEGDSVEILDNVSPCPKAREKSSLPCSQPHMRNRTCPIDKTRSNAASPNECIHENSISKRNLRNSKLEMIGKSDLPAKTNRDETTSKRQKIHQKVNLSGGFTTDKTGKHSSLDNFQEKQASRSMSPPWKTRQLPWTATERIRILERVPFESEKPFFKILIPPTYAVPKAEYLFVPLNFAQTYLKNQGEAVLSVPNGRSWSVKFRTTPARFKNCTARLSKGWQEFAVANNLEVGDVCIFKLIDATKISFEVSIVRFAEYAHLECSQAGDYATGASKPKDNVRVIIDID